MFQRPVVSLLRAACRILLVGLLAVATQTAAAQVRAPQARAVKRLSFQANGQMLVVEILDDDLAHFELRPATEPFNATEPLYTSPMVHKADYAGPFSFHQPNPRLFATNDLQITVDPNTLGVSIIDRHHRQRTPLTTIRPWLSGEDKAPRGLVIEPHDMQNVYGLGEQFIEAGNMDGDWVGRVRAPAQKDGNTLHYFDEERGNVGNAQFPIMYAVGPSNRNYAIFVDDFRAQTWDFTQTPWTLETPSLPLRWYVMTGPNLPDLRGDYMELTGLPPVPPKKIFGLWVSEFGYESWDEVYTKLRTLQDGGFPVDGFVLDLQWFGGVAKDGKPGHMGSLSWDEEHFAEAAERIKILNDDEGIGIIPIEEPYIASALPEFANMKEGGYLVKEGDKNAPPATFKAWWGEGALIDYTNPEAADTWHDLKRKPLIASRIVGHWTDLGEPEAYHPKSWFYGFPQFDQHTSAEVHNAFNFRWAESIFRGYARHDVMVRPFNMTRSGTSGIQRFAVAMWSGDIGSRLTQLAAHLNCQMHMSLSGMDYYGSDVGGFQRWSLDGDLNEMYTQWFANSAAFDIPLRPHTSNCDNKHETAPDRIGDRKSNLANLRRRYELIPYYYSLAHRANQFGEPIFPPLVYYYQNDPTVRTMSNEKLIGRDLLVACVSEYGRTKRDVYLPAGTWVDTYTGAFIDSKGQMIKDVPVIRDGLFRLPTYARAGALIPEMFVDDKTTNAIGRRSDDSRIRDFYVRVYAGKTPSSFVFYEDDGKTMSYKKVNHVRTTVLSQAPKGRDLVVTIHGAEGVFSGAPMKRNNIVRLVVPDSSKCTGVNLGNRRLAQLERQTQFDGAMAGWYVVDKHLILAKTGVLPTKVDKPLVFHLGK